MLMGLETKKILKSPNVIFFEDRKALEKCPSGRNEGSNHVVDAFLQLDPNKDKEDDFRDDENQDR